MTADYKISMHPVPGHNCTSILLHSVTLRLCINHIADSLFCAADLDDKSQTLDPELVKAVCNI